MTWMLAEIDVPVTPIVVGGTIAICIVAMAIAQMVQSRSRERSRRELAAYVAEGSMTADEAERILAAGAGGQSSCCGGKRRSAAPPMTADA